MTCSGELHRLTVNLTCMCCLDGDCLMVAQAMDLRTSVRLARTRDVDPRLFRRVPRPPRTKVCIFAHCNSHSYRNSLFSVG